MVTVPIDLFSILPNMNVLGEGVVLEIEVFAKDVFEAKCFGVNFAIRAVDDFQTQGIVMAVNSGGDKLQFYPQFVMRRRRRVPLASVPPADPKS